MQNELRKRDAIIASLKGDIEGLRREIQERDDTIQDKEKRIYDLKKKNQELEKFKFVLDYKIKELRRQMEPKENEIKAMKEQISKVQCKGLLAGSNGKVIYQDCCTVVVCCVVTIKLHSKSTAKSKVTHIIWWTFRGLYFCGVMVPINIAKL